MSSEISLFFEGERNSGQKMLNALRNHSYFKVKLQKDTLKIVQSTFDAFVEFFDNCEMKEKMKYAGTTSDRLAPHFGKFFC